MPCLAQTQQTLAETGLGCEVVRVEPQGRLAISGRAVATLQAEMQDGAPVVRLGEVAALDGSARRGRSCRLVLVAQAKDAV